MEAARRTGPDLRTTFNAEGTKFRIKLIVNAAVQAAIQRMQTMTLLEF
jgi:hypothetical protein